MEKLNFVKCFHGTHACRDDSRGSSNVCSPCSKSGFQSKWESLDTWSAARLAIKVYGPTECVCARVCADIFPLSKLESPIGPASMCGFVCRSRAKLTGPCQKLWFWAVHDSVRRAHSAKTSKVGKNQNRERMMWAQVGGRAPCSGASIDKLKNVCQSRYEHCFSSPPLCPRHEESWLLTYLQSYGSLGTLEYMFNYVTR